MFNVELIRKDFPLIDKNENLIYFDNAATTQKPNCVLEAINDLYCNYNANPHALDYPLAVTSTNKYNEAREIVAKFINADAKEIVFTSGDTDGLNKIALSLCKKLNKGDEVLLTVAEHASNVLPWFKAKKDYGIEVNYIDLTKDGQLTLENVKKAVTNNTKIISIAHITNVLGYVVDVESICKFAHSKGIKVIVDAAQSIPHIKTDVKQLDCDFLVFSGHKIYGPTGIGVLFGKYKELLELEPLNLGGGSNSRFDMCGEYSLLLPPAKFESGTVNLEGAIGLGSAIKYIENIGMDNVEKYERELTQYAIEKMNKIEGVKIYNEHSACGIITFNYKDVFAQDLATHLSSYGVCVRSGQHRAKILTDFLGAYATVRASFGIYNTKEEIDRFVEALKKGDEFLDVYFK